MKIVLHGAICLVAAYIAVDYGYQFYISRRSKIIMIKFFKKFKNHFSPILLPETISYSQFEKFKEIVIDLVVDELPSKEISIIKNYLNLDNDKEEDLEIFNHFLQEAGIIKHKIRFQKKPFESINQ